MPILDVLRYSAEKKGYAQGLTLEEITKAITFKEIAFVLVSGAEIIEWPLIETRIARWKDDSWTKLIDIVKLHGKKLTDEQKQAMLSSLRQVVNRFQDERWFGTVNGGNLQKAVNLDVEVFFKLLESKRFARDWDRNTCRDATGIHCPVLAIWGLEDSFLPPNQSAMRLKKFLAETDHPDYQIRTFQNASHYLTKTGPAGDFVPGYLETITKWLAERVGIDN